MEIESLKRREGFVSEDDEGVEEKTSQNTMS